MSSIDFDENYVFGEEYAAFTQPIQPQQIQMINYQQNYIRKYSDNNYYVDQNLSQADIQKQNRKLSCDPQDFKVKFKTEYCKYWKQQGFCPFKDSCAFAHGGEELRYKTHLPQNYKTKKCKKFFENGFCSYGQRCQFLHILPNSASSLDQQSQMSNNRKNSQDNLSNDENTSVENNKLSKFVKYSTQLKDIAEFWDTKSFSFQSPDLKPMRPRLATFENLTKNKQEDQENNNNENADIRGQSPSTQPESFEELVL